MAPKKAIGNNGVKYSVEDYFTMLRLAKRSEYTITGYKKVFQSYAKFLNVPLDEIHHYLSVANLLKYAGSRNGMSGTGTKTNLSVLHRYFYLNGVEFDELQFNAMKPKTMKEVNDKPLELEILQKMMDLTNPHGRALLSFLISTGCRAGETCKILLSDIGRLEEGKFVPNINGDVVNVRNEIAKGGHGGIVYLTAEAREYLKLWLKDRDDYIRIADARIKGLKKTKGKRPQKDERVFATAYTGVQKIFSRLYEKVDGEKGKYHNACTIHSCRKYFRTNAAQTMHPDLVTALMRQTGYLDSTYVRTPEQQKQKEFHKGEASLYITRKDHRVQQGELEELRWENEQLKVRLDNIESRSEQAQEFLSDVKKMSMEQRIKVFEEAIAVMKEQIAQ
jgi:integrase